MVELYALLRLRDTPIVEQLPRFSLALRSALLKPPPRGLTRAVLEMKRGKYAALVGEVFTAWWRGEEDALADRWRVEARRLETELRQRLARNLHAEQVDSRSGVNRYKVLADLEEAGEEEEGGQDQDLEEDLDDDAVGLVPSDAFQALCQVAARMVTDQPVDGEDEDGDELGEGGGSGEQTGDATSASKQSDDMELAVEEEPVEGEDEGDDEEAQLDDLEEADLERLLEGQHFADKLRDLDAAGSAKSWSANPAVREIVEDAVRHLLQPITVSSWRLRTS